MINNNCSECGQEIRVGEIYYTISKLKEVILKSGKRKNLVENIKPVVIFCKKCAVEKDISGWTGIFLNYNKKLARRKSSGMK